MHKVSIFHSSKSGVTSEYSRQVALFVLWLSKVGACLVMVIWYGDSTCILMDKQMKTPEFYSCLIALAVVDEPKISLMETPLVCMQ